MAKTQQRLVSTFGHGMPKGWTSSREILGGKGAGLAAMTGLGLPVPPGFTICTPVSAHYSGKGRYPQALASQVESALGRLEKAMKRGFGDARDPLLVSVRSGSRVSMPGMMDTVLNLGLNDETVEGLAESSGNWRFAWDAYRRFLAMYSDVVLGLCPPSEPNPFEKILAERKRRRGVQDDAELDADDLQAVCALSLALVHKRLGEPFPSDPEEQLWGAITAVFRSWDNDRALAYRRMQGIPDDWGTAVNVQAMVFGNLGQDSGTGVAFTRNPASGKKELFGEFLLNAQGEDVVAGTRTPEPLAHLGEVMPRIHRQLVKVAATLERHFADMQDLEFTIERGQLYILQTRAGKRTGTAALRIATDLVKERRITKEQALLQVDPEALSQVLSPVFSKREKQEALRSGRLLARGLNAGPGAATGRLVFRSEDAVEWVQRGEAVILARTETSPEDIRGMQAAEGTLTQFGGMTSHAALVARQMGKVCVAGCGDAHIDEKKSTLTVCGRKFREGDWVSLDGTTGELWADRIPTRPSDVLEVLLGNRKPGADSLHLAFQRLLRWADQTRRLDVRANADQPEQARTAIALGAQGIGLCRTEHMFFGEKKLPAMQSMILAESSRQRRAALRRILPLQRRDFEGIFRAMGSRPVTIRTLDPPLHEFLPRDPAGVRKLARQLKLPLGRVKQRIEALHEQNPMLGMRGCRLTYLVPEILEVQVTAILEAAAKLRAEGVRCQPEIMIPLVGHVAELRRHAAIVREVAEEVSRKHGRALPYLLGTMIEVPRAALTAGEIAQEAEFVSFGTNDLTQTALAVSRDDSGAFLSAYVDDGIYDRNPFASIDRAGVGRLMELASREGRATRPDLKVGICGEHGGDPSSVGFCHGLDMDYVSCSPFRLPAARLAAAQAALRQAVRTAGSKPAAKKVAKRKTAPRRKAAKPRVAAKRARR